MAKGEMMPVAQEKIIYRTKEQHLFFENEIIDDLIPRYSDPEPCAPFRKFSLYVDILSTCLPDLLHVEVEFLNRWTNMWHTYKQWPFAALYYEDADTAGRIYEVFYGEVAGRVVRVKLTGENVAGSGHLISITDFYTVSIAMDFWD